MKSEQRHQLEQNDLADWVQSTTGWLRPYVPYLVGSVVVVVAVALIYQYRSGAAEQLQREAWTEFFDANDPAQLEVLVRRYPDSVVVPYAQLRLADFRFEKGKALLTQDHDKALIELDGAIDLYEELAGTNHPDVSRPAALGKALALETRGSRRKAVEALRGIASQYAGTSAALIAQKRVEQLETDTARDFYQQLMDYRPPAPPSLDLPPRMPDVAPQPGSADSIIPPKPSAAQDSPPAPTPEPPSKESSPPSPPSQPDKGPPSPDK